MITAPNEFVPDRILTADYQPGWYYGNYFWEQRKPPFIKRFIPAMLRDSRVRFGLKLLKGPLVASARFDIVAADMAVQDFIDKQLKKFWNESAMCALRAIEWGYSASEAIYMQAPDGTINFRKLLPLSPWDTRVWTIDGEKASIRVKDRKDSDDGFVWLDGPKGFWHVHDRQEERWFGVPRLFGAYPAWYDKYKNGGAKDAMSLFFYKYALNGEVVYYPPNMRKLPDGSMMDPRVEAQKIANERRSGATILLPNERDDKGNHQWELEYANNSASGVELMEYFRMLDKQMFEGLGIPEELIEAGQTGSGYAGRRVPAQSFFAILQELGEMLLSDVDEQIIRPLVAWNFDDSVDYTVEMLPLAASDVEEDTLPGDEETEGSQGQEGSPIGPPQQNIFQ
jgi:hypothetical protein